MQGKELIDFAKKYIDAGFPHDRSLEYGIYCTDCSTSTIVWVSGLFTVEQYLMHPNAIVPPHSHPFDTVTYLFKGQLDDYVPLINKYPDKVTFKGHTHSFTTGSKGAVLYVISKWDSVNQMESATIKYTGESMGPIHAKLKGSYENNLIST